MIRVGVLTSSRADYGIYLPLLKAIVQDSDFELRLIVFGTHLSKFHGYTLKEIELDGFVPYATLESILVGDTPNAISSTFGLTNLKFADFWNYHQNKFDVVFALGDRFEMAAAVIAAVPYGIKFAHLHGGETTLGAIDNIYRHSITLASTYHFVAAEAFKERIKTLTGSDENCVVTGSLSLVNLEHIPLLSIPVFLKKWGIDLSKPSLLVTLHPETVAFEQNEAFAREACSAFEKLTEDFQIIITMPNADTTGTIYRNAWQELKRNYSEKVFLVENFGTQSYFSCMKHVGLVVGNSSSGIIEAASFAKYVINLGDRQKGRLAGANTIDIPFDADKIVLSTKSNFGQFFEGQNIYQKEQTIHKIVSFLRQLN